MIKPKEFVYPEVRLDCESLELDRLIHSKVPTDEALLLTSQIKEFIALMPTLISRMYRYWELSSLKIQMMNTERTGISILQFIREKNLSAPFTTQSWLQCIDDVFLAGLLYQEIISEAKAQDYLIHESDNDLCEKVKNLSECVTRVFPHQAQTIQAIFKEWLSRDDSMQKRLRSA